MSLQHKKDNLDVGHCIVLYSHLSNMLTNLSSSCRDLILKLYIIARNILVILLLGVKYSFEHHCKSNVIFIPLRFLLFIFLLSFCVLNVGKFESCVYVKLSFRLHGLSNYLQIFVPKLNRIKKDNTKHVQTHSLRNFYSSYKTLCSRRNAFSYKPLTFLVYPVSTVNLLASYRPLVYMEMPNSIFFITLSSNGFYYPGNGVSVVCIACENVVELLYFMSEPSSAIYHKPGCEFIKPVESEESNNLPAQAGYFSHETRLQNGNHQPMNDSENSTILSSLPSNSHSTPPPGLLTPTLSPPTLGPPAYPVFSSTDKRTESFVGWTKNSIVTSTALVQAGFFYAGYSDCVRCFQCGLGLRSWKPGDDIYVEHQRFRPACEFLQTLLRNKPQGRVSSTEARVNSNNEQTSLDSNITDNGANQISNNFSNNSMSSRVASSVSNSNGQSENNMAHSNERSQEVHPQNAISSSLDREYENNQLLTSESRSIGNVVASLLQRENKALKDQMKCKSCKVSPVQDLFLPCGEMYTCKDCSNKFTHCPSCGKRILGTVTVFFA